VGDVGPEPGPGGEKLLETIITQVTAGLQTLIRENILHRVENGFGTGNSSRLTQTLFFQTKHCIG
jgi:hypothetical protein